MDTHLRAPLFGLLFVAFYGGMIFLAVRWSIRMRTRRAQAVADALAAAGATILAVHPAPGAWKPTVIELILDGRPVTFQIRPYSRDYYLLSVVIPSQPLPHVLIRAERGIDRLGKHMGFNREVQIGDAAFDDAAFIDTAERDDVVHRLLDPPEARSGVLAVLASGYRVDMSPEGLRATRVQWRRRPIDTAPIRAAVAALEALAPLLPRVEPTSIGRPGWGRTGGVVLVALGVGVAGMMSPMIAIAFAHPVVVRGDIVYGFLFGVALWVAAVVALFFLLRGGTRGLRQLVFAAFLLLCGVPTGGAMLAFLANAGLDDSPPVTHAAKVLAIGKGRSSDVTFASWRPDHDKLVIGMPRDRVGKLRVGDEVQVVTHPGAFGWEWVEEFR